MVACLCGQKHIHSTHRQKWRVLKLFLLSSNSASCPHYLSCADDIEFFDSATSEETNDFINNVVLSWNIVGSTQRDETDRDCTKVKDGPRRWKEGCFWWICSGERRKEILLCSLNITIGRGVGESCLFRGNSGHIKSPQSKWHSSCMLQIKMNARTHHAVSSVRTHRAVSGVCVTQDSPWLLMVFDVKVRYTLFW